MKNDNFNCPKCNKEIIQNNSKSSYSELGDLVIKSKLTFLNEDGNVLCKCGGCKNIVALPLDFIKSKGTILSRGEK